jgi:hypothetical protein
MYSVDLCFKQKTGRLLMSRIVIVYGKALKQSFYCLEALSRISVPHPTPLLLDVHPAHSELQYVDWILHQGPSRWFAIINESPEIKHWHPRYKVEVAG